MGLLDDAIREHLELKRLRGANPGLVSREENEAFGPARGDEPTHDAGEIAVIGDPAQEDDAPPAGAAPAQSESFSHAGQETAELDMRMVLADEPGRDATSIMPSVATPAATGPPSDGASRERTAIDDPLDWEMPGDGTEAEPDEHFDQDLPAGNLEDEPVEDVLEETPDFLRDTPEQERLWFEQRPPRDFDFDK